MPINEVITGNIPSTITPASASVSDVIVEGSGKGQITLEAQAPGGKWIAVTQQTGAFSVSTPDTSINYRFRPSNVLEGVRVFMGP